MILYAQSKERYCPYSESFMTRKGENFYFQEKVLMPEKKKNVVQNTN